MIFGVEQRIDQSGIRTNDLRINGRHVNPDVVGSAR